MKHDWVVFNEDIEKQPLVKCRTCGEKYRFTSCWGDGVDLQEEWDKIRAMNDCDGPGLSPKQRSEILALIHKYVNPEALKKENTTVMQAGSRLLLKSIAEEAAIKQFISLEASGAPASERTTTFKLIDSKYKEEVCLGCGRPTSERDCGCPAGIGYRLRDDWRSLL